MPRNVILPVVDPDDNDRIKKDVLSNLPMRVPVIGPSDLSGKTTLIINFLMRPYNKHDHDGRHFYRNDFKSENIYIVCGSGEGDAKWTALIEGREIPDSNVYDHYDEGELRDLLEMLKEEHLERKEEGEPVEHTLIILDDCAFTGDLKAKRNGFISEVFCNARHHFVSIILTAQDYTQISTTARRNSSMVVAFQTDEPSRELMAKDFSFTCSKKDVMKMYLECTREPHSFFLVNKTNPSESRYMNCEFKPVHP